MSLGLWLRRYLGSFSERELARAEILLNKINLQGARLQAESDAALRARALALRERARAGAALPTLLVETFALVREVSARELGLRHFDVQIEGGIALAAGHIVEMRTGEGKTLVATLPVTLHALCGEGVHVVTVNDYLAERDASWMSPVYRFFGLTVGVINEDLDTPERRAAYACDITYVTNQELVWDYLRDNLALSPDEQVQRGQTFALIDELDLLLLDEAGTPLIISGAEVDGVDLSQAARVAVATLQEGVDFKIDHKSRQAMIEEAGFAKLEQHLGVENLAAPEHVDWQHALHNALLAHAVHQRDVDYIVQDGEVLLVDDFTGRVSPDKRFADGLHQALEAKEGLSVKPEDRTLAQMSYQMYFRRYRGLCGMTGTAFSAKEELAAVYGAGVVVVPPHRRCVRQDEPAVVFVTASEKFAAAVARVAEAVAQARPVLLGTTSVKESEHVAGLLLARGIAHTVLNAKDDRAEATIIAQAGRPMAVTVSTNMAGRGVDIILGGSSQGLVEGSEAWNAWQQDRARVLAAGGLLVIGTGLHESQRIDDQLRGRAGRQGDPGGSCYYLCLDDPIFYRFGAASRGRRVLDALRERLRDHPSGEPVTDRVVLATLFDLQKKVELDNESTRKDVLRYDLVIEHQRNTIYAWRQALLEASATGGADLAAILCELEDELSQDAQPLTAPESVAAFIERLRADGTLAAYIKAVLVTLDSLWTDHLCDLERLDDAVTLSRYGHLDPLQEYQRGAYALYQRMLCTLLGRVFPVA